MLAPSDPSNWLLDDLKRMVEPLGVPVFIVECVEEGFYLRHLNHEHYVQTGQHQETVVNRPIEETAPSRLASLMIEKYQHCVGERRSIDYEEALIFPTGPSTWRTTLSPFFNAEGIVQYIVGISIEISEVKEKELNLAQKQSDLESANEAIRRLNSTIAHDLRAPLRKIAVMADLIEENFEDLGDNKLEFVEATRSIAQRALAYVDLIVNQAKAIDGQPVAAEAVHFRALINNIIGTLDPIHEYDITVVGDELMVERVALEVVARNLLDNAIKFAKKAVAVTLKGGGDGWVEFSVSDDGPGLDDETLLSLKEGRATESGMGLRTVLRIIHGRGGNLDVETSPSGTTFSVRFPGHIGGEEG